MQLLHVADENDESDRQVMVDTRSKDIEVFAAAIRSMFNTRTQAKDFKKVHSFPRTKLTRSFKHLFLSFVGNTDVYNVVLQK
jgi:hypothetical protein